MSGVIQRFRVWSEARAKYLGVIAATVIFGSWATTSFLSEGATRAENRLAAVANAQMVVEWQRSVDTKLGNLEKLVLRSRSIEPPLFTSDKNAHTKTASALKGWFRTKTGVGDKVAEKMATTFRSLAQYADFSASPHVESKPAVEKPPVVSPVPPLVHLPAAKSAAFEGALGLVYRIEIHLPDTQNIDTYRAIFRALREELGT
jgi:hypothetical protein